jgi:pyruvate,water dikinase
MEDISVVTDALGESKGYHLIKNYDDLINLGIKCWQYHFEFLNLGYAAYVFFMDFTQKLFPSIPAAAHHADDLGHRRHHVQARRRAQGTGEEGRGAGRRRRRGLQPRLGRRQARGGEAAQGRRVAGRLREGALSLVQHLHRHRLVPHTTAAGTTLDIPLSGIQTYIGKIKAGVSIDRPVEQVRAERDRITAEYRG